MTHTNSWALPRGAPGPPSGRYPPPRGGVAIQWLSIWAPARRPDADLHTYADTVRGPRVTLPHQPPPRGLEEDRASLRTIAPLSPRAPFCQARARPRARVGLRTLGVHLRRRARRRRSTPCRVVGCAAPPRAAGPSAQDGGREAAAGSAGQGPASATRSGAALGPGADGGASPGAPRWTRDVQLRRQAIVRVAALLCLSDSSFPGEDSNDGFAYTTSTGIVCSLTSERMPSRPSYAGCLSLTSATAPRLAHLHREKH
eukprot:scaffold2126_cov417-Prasinococcus_capsulatus_cf.AAC.8